MNCPTPPLSLETARNIILQTVQPLPATESIPLIDTPGRILAEAVHAPSDVPPFAASAMDGYALRSTDVSRPSILKVIGSVYAGTPFQGRLRAGECVQIFTGATVPDDADAVVIQEDVTHLGDDIGIDQPVRAGDNIRPRGDEALAGDLILSAGQRLTAENIGLIASLGYAAVKVKPKPRVALLTTGNELRPVGSPLGPGQIYDSNRYLLTGLLKELGLEPIDFGIIPDEPDALRETLQQAALQADVIMTTGGASVGEADWVVETVRELGQIHFWKVAIKPGKPFLFGQIGHSYLFGLPGNPVAVGVTFRQLVYPGLVALMGGLATPQLHLKAISTDQLRKQPGRMEFRRGTLWTDDQGELRVSALAKQGSHQLSALSAANCFIVLAAECSGIAEQQPVTVIPIHNTYG